MAARGRRGRPRRKSLAEVGVQLRERAAAQSGPEPCRIECEIGCEFTGRVVGGAERHGEVLVEQVDRKGGVVFGAVGQETGVECRGAASEVMADHSSVAQISAMETQSASEPEGTTCEASAEDVGVDDRQRSTERDEGLAETAESERDEGVAAKEPADGLRDTAVPIVCEIPRGRRAPNPLPIVGDYVRVVRSTAATGAADGFVTEVLERHTTLLRRHPLIPQKPQALCSNIDIAVLVVSVAPNFSEGMVDRVLLSAHKQGFDAALVLNKVDLIVDEAERETMDERLEVYERVGYTVIRTSVVTGEGIPDLRRLLAGQTGILIGNSGVGKSHLLNELGCGQIAARVGAISERLKLGLHTTTTSTLHRLPGEGPPAFLIDSPGARRFGVWDVEAVEVRDHFIEFLPYAPKCRFRNCTHLGEPGCAVIAAANAGAIPRQRLQSYARIRKELLQGREGEKIHGGMLTA